MALSKKQEKFVSEYLVDLNATQAAIRAGYSKKTAKSIGQENLTKPDIQKAVSAKQQEHQIKTGITTERVLNERAKLAFFDVRKLFNSDGTPKMIHELDDDAAAVISGVDVVQIGNSEVGIGQVLKIKLSDKSSSLTALERHLGLYNDKITHAVDESYASIVEQAFVRARNAQ